MLLSYASNCYNNRDDAGFAPYGCQLMCLILSQSLMVIIGSWRWFTVFRLMGYDLVFYNKAFSVGVNHRFCQCQLWNNQYSSFLVISHIFLTVFMAFSVTFILNFSCLRNQASKTSSTCLTALKAWKNVKCSHLGQSYRIFGISTSCLKQSPQEQEKGRISVAVKDGK